LVTYLSALYQFQAQHFEIIGLERLLDNSLESVNEVHISVDDDAEQEINRHESTKVSFCLHLSLYCLLVTCIEFKQQLNAFTQNALEESAEDCTVSLRNAFIFSKTAFDFLTNVASSFFGAQDSTSSSSVSLYLTT
jgi:ubiquitin-conjugating enzyme E2 O